MCVLLSYRAAKCDCGREIMLGYNARKAWRGAEKQKVEKMLTDAQFEQGR